MPDVFDLETFIQSLIETVVWCRDQLNGSDNHKVLWSLGDVAIKLVHVPDEKIKSYCERIIADRSNRVHHLKIPEYEELLPVIRQGRLMIFFYPCTMNQGTAQIVSHNYFDYSNYPPSDTWISHIDENQDNLSAYLIAWVPPQFLDQAQQGIDSTPDESLLWLTNLTDTELDASVKEALEAANLWI